MEKPEDYFGKMVIAYGLATRQQVAKALEYKNQMEREGVHPHLGEIMILQGSLTVQQVEDLLKKQHRQIMVCQHCGQQYAPQTLADSRQCPACGHNLTKHMTLAVPEKQPVSFEGQEALLTIEGSRNTLRVLIAPQTRCFIGSSPQADIHLPDEGLAPLHCKIRNNGVDLLVFDCTNTSSTYVNGRAVDFFTLCPGDVINIGSVTIKVEIRPDKLPPDCRRLQPLPTKRSSTAVKKIGPRLNLKAISSTRLGTYLLKNGYLSAQIVSEHLKQVEQLKRQGTPRHLGQLLLERNYLTQQQLEEILKNFKFTKQFKCFKCQTIYNVNPRDINKEFKCRNCGEWLIVPQTLFKNASSSGESSGRLEADDTKINNQRFAAKAMAQQLLSREDHEELLKLQEQQKQAGQTVALSKLCLQKELMSPAQVEEILQELKAEAEEASRVVIEGYEIRRLLGKGANGIVLQAIQQKTGKVVALKVLTPDLAQQPDIATRFHREAGIAAYLRHIHLISGIETGRFKDYYYLAMEYVRGETVLDMILRNGCIFYEETINIATQITKALQYLEEKGLIHRDIKPDNILITKGGVAKLCDMGLVKSVRSDDHITRTGIVMGTPYYLSPEQVQGKTDLDIRSDIYNLGACLYHMLTGEVPFKGQTPMETIICHVTRDPVPPNELNPEIPLSVSQCVLKMMAKDPADRFQNPAQLQQALKILVKV